MTVFCDECGKALNPNHDGIYYGDGAYCPQHHPGTLLDQEIKQLELIAGDSGISSYDLDEFVHDQKASEAADINNGGLPAQLAYLCRCWGKDTVAHAIYCLVDELSKKGRSEKWKRDNGS